MFVTKLQRKEPLSTDPSVLSEQLLELFRRRDRGIPRADAEFVSALHTQPLVLEDTLDRLYEACITDLSLIDKFAMLIGALQSIQENGARDFNFREKVFTLLEEDFDKRSAYTPERKIAVCVLMCQIFRRVLSNGEPMAQLGNPVVEALMDLLHLKERQEDAIVECTRQFCQIGQYLNTSTFSENHQDLLGKFLLEVRRLALNRDLTCRSRANLMHMVERSAQGFAPLPREVVRFYSDSGVPEQKIETFFQSRRDISSRNSGGVGGRGRSAQPNAPSAPGRPSMNDEIAPSLPPFPPPLTVPPPAVTDASLARGMALWSTSNRKKLPEKDFKEGDSFFHDDEEEEEEAASSSAVAPSSIAISSCVNPPVVVTASSISAPPAEVVPDILSNLNLLEKRSKIKPLVDSEPVLEDFTNQEYPSDLASRAMVQSPEPETKPASELLDPMLSVDRGPTSVLEYPGIRHYPCDPATSHSLWTPMDGVTGVANDFFVDEGEEEYPEHISLESPSSPPEGLQQQFDFVTGGGDKRKGANRAYVRPRPPHIPPGPQETTPGHHWPFPGFLTASTRNNAIDLAHRVIRDMNGVHGKPDQNVPPEEVIGDSPGKTKETTPPTSQLSPSADEKKGRRDKKARPERPIYRPPAAVHQRQEGDAPPRTPKFFGHDDRCEPVPTTTGQHGNRKGPSFPEHNAVSFKAIVLCPRSPPMPEDHCSNKRFGDYEVISSAKVSPIRDVPAGIPLPPYIKNGTGQETAPEEIEIKTTEQIEAMRKAGKLASQTLDMVGEAIKPGVTTDYLDSLAHSFMIKNGAYPSPLLYFGYPKSICTSVNNVACHGIPDSRPLKEGDIITVDVTAFLNGYHGDCARTFVVGGLSRIDLDGQHLYRIGKKCLEEAIAIVKPGLEVGKIGEIVEKTALENGLNVIPAFGGHGIGSYFHGKPNIYHFWNTDKTLLEPGMTFTIEPCITQGAREIMILDDGWTAVTHDCARTAQFEHTLLVTEGGVEILTPSDDPAAPSLPPPPATPSTKSTLLGDAMKRHFESETKTATLKADHIPVLTAEFPVRRPLENASQRNHRVTMPPQQTSAVLLTTAPAAQRGLLPSSSIATTSAAPSPPITASPIVVSTLPAASPVTTSSVSITRTSMAPPQTSISTTSSASTSISLVTTSSASSQPPPAAVTLVPLVATAGPLGSQGPTSTTRLPLATSGAVAVGAPPPRLATVSTTSGGLHVYPSGATAVLALSPATTVSTTIPISARLVSTSLPVSSTGPATVAYSSGAAVHTASASTAVLAHPPHQHMIITSSTLPIRGAHPASGTALLSVPHPGGQGIRHSASGPGTTLAPHVLPTTFKHRAAILTSVPSSSPNASIGLIATAASLAPTSNPTSATTSIPLLTTSSVVTSNPSAGNVASSPKRGPPIPASTTTLAAASSLSLLTSVAPSPVPTTANPAVTSQGGGSGPPSTAAPTTHSPVGAPQFQRLKVEDALTYLDQVKYRFSNQPQVYNDFLDIMKEFKSQSIDTPGVIERVSNLFKGHPELIVGFNTFLPDGYKIEVEATLNGRPILGHQGTSGGGVLQTITVVHTPDGVVKQTSTTQVPAFPPPPAHVLPTVSVAPPITTPLPPTAHVTKHGPGQSHTTSHPIQHQASHSGLTVSSVRGDSPSPPHQSPYAGPPTCPSSLVDRTSSRGSSENTPSPPAREGATGPAVMSHGQSSCEQTNSGSPRPILGHQGTSGGGVLQTITVVHTPDGVVKQTSTTQVPAFPPPPAHVLPTVSVAPPTTTPLPPTAHVTKHGPGHSHTTSHPIQHQASHSGLTLSSVRGDSPSPPHQPPYAGPPTRPSSLVDRTSSRGSSEYTPSPPAREGATGPPVMSHGQSSLAHGGVPSPAPPTSSSSSSGPGNTRVDFNKAIDYVNNIKSRFSDKPDIYKQFLEILHMYQREQRTLREDPSVAGKTLTEAEVYAKVARLFEGQRDLLAQFRLFLPDATEAAEYIGGERLGRGPHFAGRVSQDLWTPSNNEATGAAGGAKPRRARPPPMKSPPSGSPAMGSPSHSPMSASYSGPSSHHIQVPLGGGSSRPNVLSHQGNSSGLPNAPSLSGASSVPIVAVSSLKRSMPPSGGSVSPSSLTPPSSLGVSAPHPTPVRAASPIVPPPTKKPRVTSLRDVSLAEAAKYGSLNEFAFFDKVRNALRSEPVYNNFLKCIMLYNCEIVSRSDLVSLVTQFLTKHPDLLRWFKDFVGMRDGGQVNIEPVSVGVVKHERKQERISGNLAAEIDYTTCRRLGASYCALPKAHQQLKSSGLDQLGKEVLNNEWVSFPSWSEDTTFACSRKSAYEEYIFRSEDERFELDVVLETNYAAIVALEEVQQRISRISPEEQARYKLDDRLGGRSNVLQQRALKRIYGDKAADIIEGLKRNPALAIPVVLRRLKAKQQDWKEAQMGFNKIWRDNYEKYYLKSLDVQGANFKQNDAKTLRSKYLLNEIETLYDERKERDDEGLDEVPQTGPHQTFKYKSLSILKVVTGLLIHHVKRQPALDNQTKAKMKSILRVLIPDLFNSERQELSDDEDADTADSSSALSSPAQGKGAGGGGSSSDEEGRRGGRGEEEGRRGGRGEEEGRRGGRGEEEGRRGGRGEEEGRRGGRGEEEGRRGGRGEEEGRRGGRGEEEGRRGSRWEEERRSVRSSSSEARRVKEEKKNNKETTRTSSRRKKEDPPGGGNTKVKIEPKEEPEAEPPNGCTKEVVAAVKKENLRRDVTTDMYSLIIGNNHWYLFFRLHFILCERLLAIEKAAEKAGSKATKERESSSEWAANALALKPRSNVLDGVEPSDYFSVIVNQIKNLLDCSVDPPTYEDNLREIIGIEAFTAFTMDKLIAQCVKQLQNMATEDQSQACLRIYEEEKRRGATGGLCSQAHLNAAAELAYQRRMEAMLADQNCFKMHVYAQDSLLTVELLDTDTDDADSVSNYLKWSDYVESYFRCDREPPNEETSEVGRRLKARLLRKPLFLARCVNKKLQRQLRRSPSPDDDQAGEGRSGDGGGKKRKERKGSGKEKKGKRGNRREGEEESDPDEDEDEDRTMDEDDEEDASGSEVGMERKRNVRMEGTKNSAGSSKISVHEPSTTSAGGRLGENYKVQEGLQCNISRKSFKMSFVANTESLLYRRGCLKEARTTHPAVSRKFRTRFDNWHKTWLNRHASDSQKRTVADWFMGKCSGLAPDHTTERVVVNEHRKPPYTSYVRYRVTHRNGPVLNPPRPTTDPATSSYKYLSQKPPEARPPKPSLSHLTPRPSAPVRPNLSAPILRPIVPSAVLARASKAQPRHSLPLTPTTSANS
ncbi:unnamed protein product [Cyprideis torosa]|uniref:Methionine aminopeptidase n=1 Tax=Cyprideis torosa TaxID=163714 RepID=A0A7R8WBN6_9CRUS|nr:unnamed protein product [Cyprideis torosa]CAG0887572.1 unnamed protein product [Cyprideis torosa]